MTPVVGNRRVAPAAGNGIGISERRGVHDGWRGGHGTAPGVTELLLLLVVMGVVVVVVLVVVVMMVVVLVLGRW